MKPNRLALAVLLAASITAGTVLASPCPSTNVINNPSDFVWTYHPAGNGNPEPYYSGTMEVGQATFNINGYTLTTRAYGQAGQAKTIPAPTLRVVPGNKYVLRFHNKLPYEALSTAENSFKDPNVSNLHTHGLHVSGEAPGDDVTRSFEGQRGGDFVYDIPADHMGGTYWFHAHHHGSTFLQVAGGAFGMLIVDDSNDGIPANVAAMAERQLAIAYLDPGAAGTGGDTLLSGTLPASWTVNGQLNGNVCMPVNEWQHWRILLADRNASEKTITISAGCETKLLARDGVWRTVAPKNIAGAVTITGASRADLAVRCTADATIKVGTTTVANIYASGAGNTAPHPMAADGVSTWSARRPAYLRDLRSVSSVHAETVSMGARTINGVSFNHSVPTFTLQANAVQQWSLSAAARHPFHLHVYHVQTVGCGGDYEDGEYYDVVAGSCNVRFDLNPATSTVYAGRDIMHCHILDHEDQGAMGWSEVLGGIDPPLFPADPNMSPPFSEYYSLTTATPPAAPSSLVTTAASSSRIDLSWVDNSSDETSFVVERSLDGSTFTSLATVAAGTTAFANTGLNASTTYWYRVRATNSAGSSTNSNTASAKTLAASTGTSLTVGSVVVSTVSAGGSKKRGQAVVTVKDNLGNLVSNATVTGTFSGAFAETKTGTTASNGQTTIQTTGTKTGTITFQFCVTSVTHASLTSFSGSVCSTF